MSRRDRVLVLGAGGMLGRALIAVLRDRGLEVRGLARYEFDVLRDPWERIAWCDYDVVVNALGAIPQKYRDAELLDRVNGTFPRTVATWCDRWIQISTDCVFSGRVGRYTITDRPDPIDPYGRSKLMGEVGLVVRGSFLGEGEPSALLEHVRRQTTMRGYSTHWWNGVSCLSMARMVAQLVDAGLRSGIVHVAGAYRLSKYEVCCTIAEVYGCRVTIAPVSVDDVDRTLVPTVAVLDSLRDQLRVQQRFYEAVSC